MDTNTAAPDNTGDDRLDEVEKLTKQIADLSRGPEPEVWEFIFDLIQPLGVLVSALDKDDSSSQDVTRSECNEIVRSFVRDFNAILSSQVQARDSTMQRLKEHSSKLDQVCRRAIKIPEAHDRSRWAESLRQHFDDSIAEIELDVPQHQTHVLQTGLLKIMFKCGGDESDRHLFWKEHLSQFGSHLEPKKTLKPVATTVDGNPSAHTQLPSEIMSLIYDFADLETCVSLREVSSAWYSVFRQVDFKAKMKHRNPWFVLQDDFSAYTDCVLVFVARLKRWQTADSVDEIDIPAEKKQPRKTVVGTKLESDERFPTNFVGMMGEIGGEAHSDKLPVDRFLRDQWTLEASEVSYEYNVVTVDDEKTVIECDNNLHVTLPSSIRPENIAQSSPVLLTESFVAIQLLDNKLYLLPRDKPHFDHGFLLDGRLMELRAPGGALFRRFLQPSGEGRIYSLLDHDTKEMVEYGPANELHSGLVASYNGLVWWWQRKPKGDTTIVPTFIDLASPGKVYYCPGRAVTGLSNNAWDQGSRPAGMAQFVVSKLKSEDGLELVDLATGIITDVLAPSDWNSKDHETLIGFVRDQEDDGTTKLRFQARVMHERTVEKATKEVLQKLGEWSGSESEGEWSGSESEGENDD